MKRTHWTEQTRKLKYNLNCNENQDKRLRNFIKKEFKYDNITDYPDIESAYIRSSELYECTPYDLYLTTGSEQCIKNILWWLSDNGNKRTITHASPTFGMVSVYADIFKIKTKPIAYTYINNQFSLNLPPTGDILYIASPDNFTGHTFNATSIQTLCRGYKHVILDLAYQDIDTVRSYINIICECDNISILHTFSKLYAAAGARVGFVFSSNENIEKIYRYKQMIDVTSIGVGYINFVSDNIQVYRDSISRMQECNTMLEATLGKCIDTNTCFYSVYRYTNNVLDNSSFAYRLFNIQNIEFVRITTPDESLIELINETIVSQRE